jgi:beta-glucanase (GH16 family)
MTRPRALAALAAPFVIAAGLTLSASARTGVRDGFTAFDGARWTASAQHLGRGELRTGSARVADGALALTIPRGTRDGAGLRSRPAYGDGRFEARIRVPAAGGSLTGLFLHRGPAGESEIDLEIRNDDSRQALLTVYSRGQVTHSDRVLLPFDPTRDFHTYSIQRRGGSVTFRADGERLRTFEGGVPRPPMHLHLTTWWPRWLAGKPLAADVAALVDWVETPAQ